MEWCGYHDRGDDKMIEYGITEGFAPEIHGCVGTCPYLPYRGGIGL